MKKARKKIQLKIIGKRFDQPIIDSKIVDPKFEALLHKLLQTENSRVSFFF